MATPIFYKFLGVMFGLPQGTCLPNRKSISLAVLEQLAFNDQKFTGLLDAGDVPLSKNFKGHVWTVPGNVPAKFEVPSFNRFGIISTYFPKN